MQMLSLPIQARLVSTEETQALINLMQQVDYKPIGGFLTDEKQPRLPKPNGAKK